MKKLFKNTKKSLIVKSTNFPSGIAVKTDKNTYWVRDGKLYRIISERAENSWSFTTVHASESALSKFKVVGKLGFRDGTLIKDISDGKIYLISQNKRRHITSPDVFDNFGLDRSKIVEVSSEESEMHLLGEKL